MSVLPSGFEDLARMLGTVPGVVAIRTDRTLEEPGRSLLCLDVGSKGRPFRFQISRSKAGVEHLRQQLPAALAHEDVFIERADALIGAYPFQEWPIAPAPAGSPLPSHWAAPLWRALEASPVDRIELCAQASEGPEKRPARSWVQAYVGDLMVLSIGWAALVNATRVELGSTERDNVSHVDSRLTAWKQALGLTTEGLVGAVVAIAPLVLLGPSARYGRTA